MQNIILLQFWVHYTAAITSAGFGSVAPPADGVVVASPGLSVPGAADSALFAPPAAFGTNSGAEVLNRILLLAWGLFSGAAPRVLYDAGLTLPGG
jgi:hypothetical protein